jgi:hypothetical protein
MESCDLYVQVRPAEISSLQYVEVYNAVSAEERKYDSR